jgi:hypothetical protein
MSLAIPIASPVRRLALPGATLLLALALGACSAGPAASGVLSLEDPSATPDPSAAPSESIDPEEAIEAFTACMKEHGVDVQIAIAGDGGAEVGGGFSRNETVPGAEPAQPGTGPGDPEKMAEADEACRHLLPAGGMGDPSATMDPELADQMLAFAKCMRDHGIDFPDPPFSGGGVTVQLGGPGEQGLDPTSDEFQAAQEACGENLPDGGPFVTGGATAP